MLARSISGNSIRSKTPLTESQMQVFAPSIFQTFRHEERSERYTTIPTIDILTALQKEGFMPFMACQSRVRDEGKKEFARHMIRLRHTNSIEAEEANEIILLNSHDGTSSYQMLAGCFRFVCQNGLVKGETVEDIRIRHKGDIIGNVIEGAYRVLDNFELMDQSKDSMKSVILSPKEQNIFASSALQYKYEDEVSPISEEQVLRPRRWEDKKNDLWSTFNRIQENLTQGGLHGRSRDANGRIRNTTTRQVVGIDSNVKLNKALWSLSEAMLNLKKGS